jgi:hypothetical protein
MERSSKCHCQTAYVACAWHKGGESAFLLLRVSMFSCFFSKELRCVTRLKGARVCPMFGLLVLASDCCSRCLLPKPQAEVHAYAHIVSKFQCSLIIGQELSILPSVVNHTSSWKGCRH